MFGPLGIPELLFILVLALLIFGPRRLPEIGRTLGKGMAEFRRASNELKRTVNSELALDEAPAPAWPKRLEPAAAPAVTAPPAVPQTEPRTGSLPEPDAAVPRAEPAAEDPRPLEPQ
jgi:TatA/E family protein of Tat protein translocase